MDDNLGTTRMLIHSEKGIKIFEEIKNKFNYKEVEPEKIIFGFKELEKSAKYNSKRDEFFKDIDEIRRKKLS